MSEDNNMSLSLESLLGRFKEEDEKKQRQGDAKKPNTEWLPFWKIDFDQTMKVRFLPDADPNAGHFFKEKYLHKLNVSIKGKETQRQVPCLSMYGEECPICAVSDKFYKENDKVNGSRFWKKKSYIAQVWVVESPVEIEGSRHKLVNLESKIYEGIKKAMQQGDVDALPTDYEKGYTFRLNKTKSGTYADFTTSKFEIKPSALPQDVVASLKLFNLSEKLPRKPKLEYVEAVLHAALTGEEFVWNSKNNTGDAASEDDHDDQDDQQSASTPMPAKAATAPVMAAKANPVPAPAPAQDTTVSTSGGKMKDVMAILNKRRQQ